LSPFCFGGHDVPVVYRLVVARASQRAAPPAVSVAQAARTLEIGTLIKEADLKTGSWVGTLPAGMATRLAAAGAGGDWPPRSLPTPWPTSSEALLRPRSRRSRDGWNSQPAKSESLPAKMWGSGRNPGVEPGPPNGERISNFGCAASHRLRRFWIHANGRVTRRAIDLPSSGLTSSRPYFTENASSVALNVRKARS
jgi:hypothetical protein